MRNVVQPQDIRAFEAPTASPLSTEKEAFGPTAPRPGRALCLPPSIPDHEMLRIIGRGAYGEVWLARNVMGTYRAVKIVFRAQFEDDHPYEREFKGIQKFEPASRSHDGLVDILQIGRNERLGYFYYVMELADPQAGHNGGEEREEGSLSQPVSPDDYEPCSVSSKLRRRGRLPINECVTVGLALTSALEHLHKNALAHRDIKPSNIIVVNGIPKLADIGLVADLGEAKSFVGTLGYIPPEGPGTAQADLYSLGKVLYEMSTGRDRHDFPQLPTDLKEFPNFELLVEFNEILLKACEPERSRRYQSAAEMGADLELMQGGKSVKRKRAVQRGLALCKKAGLAIALLALVTSGAIYALRAHGNGELHSKNPEVENLIELGDQLLLKRTKDKLALALGFFNEAAKLDPTFPPVYIGLFRVRIAQGGGFSNPDADADANVLAAATNLIKIAPHLAEARIAESFLNYCDGRLSDALANARQAARMPLASRRGGGLVHFLHAFYLLNAGCPEEALKELQLAEKAFPGSPDILRQLGNAYMVLGRFDLAMTQFQKSIELEERQVWAYYGIGSVYEQQGKFPQAIDQFEKSDLNSGRDEAETKTFYNELREAFKQGGPEGYWNKHLERTLRASPPNGHDVAINLARLGRLEEAYRWLEKSRAEGKLAGLWSDLCWDHNDKQFKEIASKIGMKP